MKRIIRTGIYCIVFIQLSIGIYGGLKINEVGLKFGLNTSMFSNSKEFLNQEFFPIAGEKLGDFFTIKFANKLFSQTEIYYNKIGCKIRSEDHLYKFKFNYLEFAHLIRADFPFNSKNKFSILLGPFNSFLVNSEGIVLVNNTERLIDNSGHTFIWDYGFIFALNYSKLVGNKRWWLDMRYTQGLGQIFKQTIPMSDLAGIESSQVRKMYFKSISVLFGFSF